MEKYGFVYIWFDKKRKMFYVGSHWGSVDDGYICSSNRMRKAFKRRPSDFKRKILEKVENRSILLETEQKWLSLAEGKKYYYNLCFTTKSPWWNNENSRLTIGQKISKAHRSNPNHGSWTKGKVLSEETRKKISEKTSLGLQGYYEKKPRTEATRKKISENTKKLQAEGKIGMHGKIHKAETIEKMKKNNAMNNPIHIDKVKASKQGIRWLSNGTSKKMAVPGTNKYNELLQNGFYALNRSM